MIFQYLYNFIRYDLIGYFGTNPDLPISITFDTGFEVVADYLAILICIVVAVIIVFLSILILKVMFCLLIKIFDR